MSIKMQNEIDALRFDVKLLQAQVLELLTWQMEMDPPQRPVITEIDHPNFTHMAVIDERPRNKGGWPKGKPRKVKHEEAPASQP